VEEFFSTHLRHTAGAKAGLPETIAVTRISGAGQKKAYYAWRPPMGTSFHVPQAFGTLRLRNA
jgi:hypothetical protein